MPINFVPRNIQREAPRQGALQDAWNTALKAYGKDPGSMLTRFGEFEPNQIVKVEQGRTELNANMILEAGIRLPSYTLEAPLRPLNVATGGAVEDALAKAWEFGKQTPVLGMAFAALEGVGGVLEASNKVARGFLNYTLAEHLKNVAGKPDSFVSNVWGESLTAEEIRKRATDRWGVNAFTGQEFSLEELTARAMKNTMDFGEFDVHENGVLNFGAQVLADPLNLALIGGGAAIGLSGRALQAAPWAKPAMNFGTRMAGAPRIGYGYMKSVGRVAAEHPTGARMVDQMTSARRILEGQLVEHGTLAGALRATSWMMRGLYMPGYAGNIQRGMGRTRAGLVAWQRGGAQQMLATTAAEQLSGAANGLVVDMGLEGSVVDGFTSWVHDVTEAINNDHIISDNDAVMVAALFSPWGTAIADIPRSIKATRTSNGLPRYAENTLFHVKDEFRKTLGIKDDYNTIFTKIGQGDIAAGKRAWEWFVDQAEVMKVGNQLSNYTRQVADLDDLASRQAFLTQTAVEKVGFLREKAALQPNSLADYMIDMYRNGPVAINGDTLAHNFSITADGFYEFVGNLHRMNQHIAPQFEKLTGLQITQGAPITREILDGIIDDLDGVPDGIIPRDMAAHIFESGPSIVWEGEFWQRMSVTLGQRLPDGTFRKPVTAGENVSVAEVRERLLELRESAPPASELFHESVAAQNKAVKIRPGETLISEPPYKVPDKLQARRVYNTGRVAQLIEADTTLTRLRNTEFYKNGKSKMQSARQLGGDEGGVYRRQADGTMMRDDGMGFTVQDGVLKATVNDPATGMIRVYRGEGGVAASSKGGRWFTQSTEVARSYNAKGTPLRYVDLTPEEFAKFRTTVDSPDYAPGFTELRLDDDAAARAKPFGLDGETLRLGVRNGGRTVVMPYADGQFLAANGFVEVARISGTNLASYAYKGGDTTQILQNSAAGAFRPYKPAKKVTASEAAAIKRAQTEANKASLLYPSMEAIGPSPTRSARLANPDERLRELQALQDQVRAERKSLVKSISETDRIAMELSGIDTNIANLGDWFNHASKTEIEGTIALIKDVNRNYPTMSVRPGESLWIDPRVDRFSMLANHRSLYRRMAFEYGNLSPISTFYNALLAPLHARWLGKQTQTEIHTLLAQAGYTAKESKKFVTDLREEVMRSRSVPGSLSELSGTHLYRTINALPEMITRDILEKAAPGKSAEVIKRYGHVQKMLTEAGNRLLRGRNVRARGGTRGGNPLAEAANRAFRVWQYAPGVRVASAGTRQFAKFLYPLLRFSADPLYHLMNMIEPDMYGVSLEGAKATRFSKGVVNREQSANAAEQAALTSIPPGGLRSKELPVEFLLSDAGAYTMPRHMRPIIERHFDKARIQSAEDIFRAIPQEHPVAITMREMFGDDVKDWAQAADEIMYGYMTKGPEATVMDEVTSVLDDMGIGKEEAKALAPMMERLASAHRGNYNDLVNLYVGRLNRSNLERTLDHFFLFWPLSYQIKATTWLARIMFQRIGGVNTGAGGAYAWTEYKQRWEQSMNADPEFKAWAEDNRNLLFMTEMLFPMTPMGIGVSLSRPTRYVGSWIAGDMELPQEAQDAIGEYPYIRTVGDLLTNSVAVGPVRTERLWSDILNQLNVPFFNEDEQEALTDTPALPGLPR